MLHGDCIQMSGSYDFGIKLMNQNQNSVLCYFNRRWCPDEQNPDCITVLRQWDGVVSIADIKIGEKATKISIQSEKIVTFVVCYTTIIKPQTCSHALIYWSMAMQKYILMLPCNTFKKCIPFVQKAWKMCVVHTSVSDKNQSTSQTKGFMYGLVPKISETCECVANIFFYTWVQILHI